MITNEYRIPKIYADAIVGEPQEPRPANRYSATKLIGSVRQGVLGETEESYEDVSDLFPAFLGTAIHYYLEHHIPGNNELHLEAKIGENTITGKIDSWDEATGTITDYKVRKCHNDDFKEAFLQLRIYAWLLLKNGMKARTGRVVAIRKDWSKMRNPTQPPIETYEFSLSSFGPNDMEEWIANRIAEFEKARVELPDCTEEEKWKQPDSWAVYAHEGDAKAKRVFQTEDEAKRFAKGEMFVEHRVGKYLKCENFCKFAKICRKKKKNS